MRRFWVDSRELRLEDSIESDEILPHRRRETYCCWPKVWTSRPLGISLVLKDDRGALYKAQSTLCYGSCRQVLKAWPSRWLCCSPKSLAFGHSSTSTTFCRQLWPLDPSLEPAKEPNICEPIGRSTQMLTAFVVRHCLCLDSCYDK